MTFKAKLSFYPTCQFLVLSYQFISITLNRLHINQFETILIYENWISEKSTIVLTVCETTVYIHNHSDHRGKKIFKVCVVTPVQEKQVSMIVRTK